MTLTVEHPRTPQSERRGANCQRAIGVVIAIATMLLLLLAPSATAQNSDDPGESELAPGNGHTLLLARPSWDSGWFQAELMAQLLVELGYVIDGPTTYENAGFYESVVAGDVDLWVNGWFPNHDPFLPQAPDQGARPVGFEVRGGALQGYMVDLQSVEEIGITSLADLADPEIAARFDADGDGRADLIGCNRDWACHDIVEHHIEAFDLSGTVEQISADYGPLMDAAARRYASGVPLLYFNYTPNWTNGILVPGRDVAWVPTPFASLPDDIADMEDASLLPGVIGCLDDPCQLGFPPNDIRAVANDALLADEPAVAALLAAFSIDLEDIAAQNALMFRGEDSEEDISAHAAAWLRDNRSEVDDWLEIATQAHLDAGGQLGPKPAISDASEIEVGMISVATRPAPPFVVYNQGSYGGFTIELLHAIAAEVGADIDVYGVATNAKLIDDVSRGRADVGAGAIAITSQRERRIDFSESYFDSGLAILVTDEGGSVFRKVVGSIISRDVLLVILSLFLVLLVAAHLMWLAERRTNPEFPAAYREGIWEALWWAAVTATTVGYGDKTPKGKFGRLFALLWMFAGLFLLAYFTAGIASAVAIDRVESNVESVADLRGQSVGVIADSLGDGYLGLQSIRATEYAGAEDAYEALRDGTIDAVVHDVAILQHHVSQTDGVQLVGKVFAERGLGFAVDSDSQMAEVLNRGLIAVIESGEYETLHDRWFGTD